MPDDRTVRSGETPLQKFCREMDEQIFSNFTLRRIFNFRPQPLWAIRREEKERLASLDFLRPERLPDETDEAYTKRQDAELDRLVAETTAYRVRQHEQDYRQLRSSLSLSYNHNTPEYKAAVEQVAKQSKQTPEFIHAYVSYRRNLLMQEFAFEDPKVQEDYRDIVHPVFSQTHFRDQVEAMAKRVEAERQAEESSRNERLMEKSIQVELELDDIINQDEVLRAFANIPVQSAASRDPDHLEAIYHENRKTYLNVLREEQEYQRLPDTEPYLTRLAELERENKLKDYPVSVLKEWILHKRTASLDDLRGLVDTKKIHAIPDRYRNSDGDGYDWWSPRRRIEKLNNAAKLRDTARDLDAVIDQNEELRALVDIPIVTAADVGGDEALALQKNKEAYKAALSRDSMFVAYDTISKLHPKDDLNAYQPGHVIEWMTKRYADRLDRLKDIVDPEGSVEKIPHSFRRKSEKEIGALLGDAATGREQNSKKIAETEETMRRYKRMAEDAEESLRRTEEYWSQVEARRAREKEEEARILAEKEAEDLAIAGSMWEELSRLGDRLAFNDRASPTMKRLRYKLAEGLDMSFNCGTEELSYLMQETLDAGREYQWEKFQQKGSFSSTQLHRLKTINYMLAVDQMSKQDPPLSPGSEEGQKFMLAVKTVMSLAVGKDPKLLCDGDKIVRDAVMLSQNPAFTEFIQNSGKSIEELRKTKSMSFAKQFSAALDKAEKKQAAQPVNPEVRKQNPVKAENRNLAV